MRVLALNPGHDGAAALVDDGKLVWSIEAEKDSHPRNSTMSTATMFDILLALDAPPDVIAVGGWKKHLPGFDSAIQTGYFGLEPPQLRRSAVMGRPCWVGSSSHERSHIFAGLGMSQTSSPDLAVLTWEGAIGAFYRVRGFGERIERIPVLHGPGHRYGFLYCLADPEYLDSVVPLDVAGKLMALSAFGDADEASDDARNVVERVLAPELAWSLQKDAFRNSSLWNCGHDSADFRHAARLLSDRIFDRFLRVATAELPCGLPLLIGGGCGLNCDWNSAWEASGHFASVFVPPCPNDSGSAIGTAIDAQQSLGLGHQLEWSVAAGPEFVHDLLPQGEWQRAALSYEAVARKLKHGHIIPLVQGRAEIGPRALGQRSLLASPLDGSMQQRLNTLKGREWYRPIAPCCRADHFATYFDGRPDHYMLFFSTVKSRDLPAVTHVDGSARVQVVRPDHGRLDRLLAAFETATGVPVLCNTSLNFPGSGFINRMSELVGFCDTRRLDFFVVDDGMWCRDGTRD